MHNKEWENKIYYSQCWEDPQVVCDALSGATHNTVVSITSGGCNTLALLTLSPKKIIALDINPAQNYLLELKIAGIKSLSHEEFLSFIGVTKSDTRIEVFEHIKSGLSLDARLWWESKFQSIEQGIIHMGKFEKYLGIFRNVLLPCIHSKKDIHELAQIQTVQEQESFYISRWDTWRWRTVFKLFFNRFVMSSLGRNRALFTHAGTQDLGEYYLQKTKRALIEIPIKDNFFLSYILFGNYTDALPPYLKKENYELLQKGVDRITIVTNNIKDFLVTQPNNSIAAYNLSDIFESLTLEDTNEVFKELERVSTPQAQIVYWNNLVPRKAPVELKNIKEEVALEEILQKKDRVFFYGGLFVYTIHT
jgi:S-adenosylmethionine-diacylglycerol 3-amino-3-carboxypropyl transferase